MADKKRRALRLLTAREVLTATEGDHFDGGGLTLRVRGDSASWVFRFSSPASKGKRREMGLGTALRASATLAGRSMTQAREAADSARLLVAAGVDPIDARLADNENRQRAAASAKMEKQQERLTLARTARDYHARVIEPHRTEKHAAQWIASLENHMPDKVWHKPIATVTAADLLDVLVDLYATVPETASRIRQRLDAIFDDAVLRKDAATNLAAAIRRKLTDVGGRRKPTHFRSLPYPQVPAFMSALAAESGLAALALRLLILTASRTSEVLLATRDEFDADGRIWNIAGQRMKGGEEHVVYLSDPALAIVKSRLDDASNVTDYLFPSPTGSGEPLSNMSMLVLLKRMGVDDMTTAHGFRASFSTWANESGHYRSDVIEACLAHREGDLVRRAYNRAQFTAERKELLRAWADFATVDAAPNE